MLIDCGEATQISLRKNKIKFQKINQIFISHLHGDHYLGLPGLVSTFNLFGRTKPLDIFGPSELKAIIELHFQVSGSVLNYKINFHTIETDSKKLIFENKILSVYSIPLKHRIKTFGFVFEEKQKPRHIKSEMIKFYSIPHYEIKSIRNGKDYVDEEGNIILNKKLTNPADPSYKFAYCSDTAYFPEILEWIKDADLLFHEATFMDKHTELAQKTLHSTTMQAADIAKQSNAKQLIIGHFSSRYIVSQELVDECKTIFNNTIEAYDGLNLMVNC